MSVPTREQFLFTESFDSLMNQNTNIFMTGGDKKPSPGDALHKEAIEYLKNVLNLPELDARAYKSMAYRTVKEQHPEAKHFERAEKMLELVKSKSFVKDFKGKLDETKSILENIDSEKEKRKSESESESETKEQKGGNFSETSVMQNYTESKVNLPYYQEYLQAKNQYLQSKLRQSGGLNNLINQIPINNNINQNQVRIPLRIRVPAQFINPNTQQLIQNFQNQFLVGVNIGNVNIQPNGDMVVNLQVLPNHLVALVGLRQNPNPNWQVIVNWIFEF
jgi:hypothetical protein